MNPSKKEQFKILIVANKTWECEPLVNVLLHKDARPVELLNFKRGVDLAEKHKYNGEGFQMVDSEADKLMPLPLEADGLPIRGFLPVRPQLSFSILNDDVIVEVWCIENWMRKKRRIKTGDTTIVDAHPSSSFEKFTFALPQIRKHAFHGSDPDVVVAFGTAGIPSEETCNGCVTVGTRVFIHDPWSDASESELVEQMEKYGPLLRDDIQGCLDTVIDTESFKGKLFSNLSAEVRHSAEARFLKTPIHPADVPIVLAGHGYTALGTINICNYDDYVWADEKTLRIFEGTVKQHEIGSMETTHGLIRLTWQNTPFLFVSGITDRFPMFNSEVTPRRYSQNFVAAHNAGVFVAFLLPELARLNKMQNL